MRIVKALLLTAVCVIAAKASPIYYIETQLGIGTFNGIAFNNQLVTIVLSADTTNITNPSSGVYDVDGTATVTVAGIGTGTFTHQMEADVNQTGGAAITDTTVNFGDVLSTGNSAFTTYALTAPFGPITGPPGGNPSTAFPTTFGNLILSSSTNDDHPSTFTATLPEPGTFVLLGSGLVLAALIRLRRIARKAHLRRL